MKNNYISLKDKNGKKKDYRILFNIESSNDKLNYIIYTDESKTKSGDIKAYASSYELSDAGNMTKLKKISKKEDFEFIEKILESLQESGK